MANVLNSSQLNLPNEILHPWLGKVKFGSTIATLSASEPMKFGTGQSMTFEIGEAEYVGEGANKGGSTITPTTKTTKPFKFQKTVRWTEEVKWASEDHQLEAIEQILSLIQPALSRALDFGVYHGINPTGGAQVSAMTEYLSQTTNSVEVEAGDEPQLILDDADVDAALPNTAQVCFHAGQGCAVNTRLLVPASMYDTVVNKVMQLFSMLAPGDPARQDTVLGPVISATQQDRILGFVERAEASGAEVLTGGDKPVGLHPELAGGYYLTPTLVAGVDNSSEIAREEVFGPVMVVMPYSDDAEALEMANDSDYGLSGSVFSGTPERA
ncbi:aldehyde dehydrogenase family protein, partial [Mycobacteriaceae bacterium Msp059]|nr:aldehyde dehydrogenase family protein [Mycobacteriaceae bacterium Msp059]